MTAKYNKNLHYYTFGSKSTIREGTIGCFPMKISIHIFLHKLFNMGKKTKILSIRPFVCVKIEENNPYHQPLHSILKERDAASTELAGYLKELEYE